MVCNEEGAKQQWQGRSLQGMQARGEREERDRAKASLEISEAKGRDDRRDQGHGGDKSWERNTAGRHNGKKASRRPRIHPQLCQGANLRTKHSWRLSLESFSTASMSSETLEV